MFNENEIAVTIIQVLVFLAAFSLFAVLFMYVFQNASYRNRVSKRLEQSDNSDDEYLSLVSLMNMRRRRGTLSNDNYILPLARFNELVLQSGVTWGLTWILLGIGGLFISSSLVAFLISGSYFAAILAALLISVLLPITALQFLRLRRMEIFESQLPDAIDVLVRGLKAGHPFPVAMTTVAKEMKEPIKSEFKIVSDELVYGLDLETAMANLRSRVGQMDLALLVIAIRLQARTGGNLAEVLSKLADIVRDRFKMRRKVRALSAEGRVSAIVLSFLPPVLFVVLLIIAPDFYGSVWSEPIVKPTLIAATVWLLLGNMIMYRMVRFRI